MTSSHSFIGRQKEREILLTCLKLEKNILLEGPVGVGKTALALAALKELGRPVFRVDGDSRYSEQKLAGWFDPPLVMKKGFTEDTFIPGPLLEAMRSGGVLFVNELNRLPEGVQNILLPALDEGLIQIPKLGDVRAEKGFCVVATQNPREFVATNPLSEAVLDRFEWIRIHYPPFDEEVAIVNESQKDLKFPEKERFSELSVELIRVTRESEQIRRGGSIRAGISLAHLCGTFIAEGKSPEEAFVGAAELTLPTRIEFEGRGLNGEETQEDEKRLWIQNTARAVYRGQVKKKT